MHQQIWCRASRQLRPAALLQLVMIAQNLIQEVEWESQWDNTFSTNQESMDDMALKALQEIKDGKTDMLGFDEL